MEYFTRISRLKKRIGDCIKLQPDCNFPVDFIFQQSLDDSKYKITIQLIEEDFFFDKKGVKWVKSKE